MLANYIAQGLLADYLLFSQLQKLSSHDGKPLKTAENCSFRFAILMADRMDMVGWWMDSLHRLNLLDRFLLMQFSRSVVWVNNNIFVNLRQAYPLGQRNLPNLLWKPKKAVIFVHPQTNLN